MSDAPRPLVDRLLEATLPAGPTAEAIRGDLEQEYRVRRESGRTGALAWYVVQASSVVLWSGFDRIMGRPWSGDGDDAESHARAWRVWLDPFGQDLRFAVRSLIRHPRYSVASIGTLGLGLAASVTIFSVVETVLLRPLPYMEAERLLMVETHRISQGVADGSSVPNVEDWAAMSTTLSGITYFRRPRVSQVTLLGDAPQRLQEGLVGPGFFELIGTPPLAGRTFSDAEFDRGARVVILRHDLWQERFDSRSFGPGETMLIDGQVHSVIGVMPRVFQLPTRDTRLWRLLSVSDWWRYVGDVRDADGVVALARLEASANIERARTEMSQIGVRLREAYEVNTDRDVRVAPLAEYGVQGETRTGLWLISAAVTLLLALACANAAGLATARGNGRGREMGIRTAIGASRATLVRQLLSESLVLALFATGSALALAYYAIKVVAAFGPADVPRFEQLSLSPTALGFAAVVGLVTVAVFGILPALSASKGSDGAELASRLVDDLLVAGQVAMATILLVGGGLLVESFLRVRSIDPGYAAQNLVIVSIDLPAATYPGDTELLEYHRRARERLGGLPGVTSVGAIRNFFVETDLEVRRPSRDHAAEGGVTDWPSGKPPAVNGGGVTVGYLKALGIPLLAGRYFENRDLDLRPRAAGEIEIESIIISEALSGAFWPDQDPIGRRFQAGTAVFDAERFAYQVVGVVADVRSQGLDVDPAPAYFVSDVGRSMELSVRTSMEANSLVPAIRKELRALDGALPLVIRTAEAELAARLAQRRFQTGLVAAFAILALILATTGIYALLAYHVASRTREIGIRKALGAPRAATLLLLMSECGKPVAAGLGIGLLVAASGAGSLQNLLFEVRPIELSTYLGTALVILFAAAAAAYFPAMAATAIDPLEAVRADQ